MPDYIPAPDSAANSWLLNFAAVILADPAAYDLSAGDATDIDNAAQAFNAALATATNPATRTTPSIAAKDAQRATTESIIRPYAVTISRSNTISDVLKEDAGVTVRKLVPTPVPAPGVAPEMAVQGAIPGLLTLSYKTPGAEGKAKPEGAIGVEVRRAVGDVAAVDPAQASAWNDATKSPFQMAVEPDAVGKTLTIFARYKTRSGPGGIAQKGPWSVGLVVVGM